MYIEGPSSPRVSESFARSKPKSVFAHLDDTSLGAHSVAVMIIVTVPLLSLSNIKLSNGSFPQHITPAFPIHSETLDGATSEDCCHGERIYIGRLWLPISNFCHSYLPCACLRDPCWLQYTLFARLLVHTYPHSLTTTIVMVLIITATTSALLEHGLLREGFQMAERLCFSFLLSGFHNDLVSLGSLCLPFFSDSLLNCDSRRRAHVTWTNVA